ncbi:hypothetical protein DIS24_g12401 [Lasiodiplodia hormozganensis]|uniref:Uncharacterized protein n=1 Tax=Lasiodiplodia hormozganensis TaxID=869390 RepID=A0AA39TV55_9PEZI|nr:hypothetical protein DIS24_g12401 [Lasiodiplodia hormozganensis]
MDNVMLALLSHSSIVGSWNAAVQRKFNNYPNPQWKPCWDWSNPKVGEALKALEYMRFGNHEDLDRILEKVISTLAPTSEQQLQETDQQVQQDLEYTCFGNQLDLGLPQDNLMSMLISTSERQLPADDHMARPEPNTGRDFAMPEDQFEEYLRQIA